MSTGLYRSKRWRDLAGECIAALCTPSTDKTRDWRLAEHYSQLAKAGRTGVGRFDDFGLMDGVLSVPYSTP
jgi:hypothetical protein